MIDDLAILRDNRDRHTDAMPGEYPALELRGSELFVLDSQDTGGDDVLWHVSERVTPDPDGLYPLGAHMWPWRLIERLSGWRAVAARLRYHHDRRTAARRRGNAR
jgi:hypothetical protein